MISNSNSLCRERDAQSSGRRSTSRHLRFRAVPRTNRTLKTANTHNHSATSSTTELPACDPSLPWQCFCGDASPGACTDVASQVGYELLLGPLPPTRSATRNFLGGTNLRGEVHHLPVGMPNGGGDDHRSVESEQAPLPHRDILLRPSFLSSLSIRPGAQGPRPSWNELHRGRLGG